MKEKLRMGTFGQAFSAENVQTKQVVAIKINKSKAAYHVHAKVELAILTHLSEKDPHDKRNIGMYFKSSEQYCK